MRVLIVSTYPPQRCGIAEYTKALARELSEKHNVEVAVFAEKREWIKKQVTLDSGVLVVRGWSRNGRVDLLRALRLLVSFRPDIVHIQHEYGLFRNRVAFILSLLFLKLLRIKVVITFHTVCDVSQMIRKRIKPTWDKVVSKLADAAVVHTRQSARLLRAYGWDRNKCAVIKHGAIEVRSIEDEENHKEVNILFMGFITPRKGIELIIDALSKLREDGVGNWFFTVAGSLHPASLRRDLPYLRTLMERTAKLNLEEKVKFIIEYLSHDKIGELLRKADIVVLPYRELYGASGILRLAASYRKLVIVSDVGELSEEVVDMVNGLIFKAGDSEELTRKLKLAILDGNLRRKLGRQLYATVAARSTWRNMAELTMDVYERVLTGG